MRLPSRAKGAPTSDTTVSDDFFDDKRSLVLDPKIAISGSSRCNLRRFAREVRRMPICGNTLPFPQCTIKGPDEPCERVLESLAPATKFAIPKWGIYPTNAEFRFTSFSHRSVTPTSFEVLAYSRKNVIFQRPTERTHCRWPARKAVPDPQTAAFLITRRRSCNSAGVQPCLT